MIGSSAGGVNLLHLRSRTYARVQEQLFGLVARHLPADRVTQSVGRPVPGALNVVLHVRLGKREKQYPPPAQCVMSHGLADKSYLFVRHGETGEPLLNSFAHVLVPGEFLRRRILERSRSSDPRLRLHLREDQVHVVGWPRLDALVEAGAHVRRPVVDRPLRVLWAPSHDSTRVGRQQRRLSSYPEFEQHLPRLQEAFDVRVSLHPRNRTEKSPTTGQLEWADVVISDFGTMVYEAWALGKGVVFPRWLMPRQITTRLPHTAEAHIYRERIGLHAGSVDELVEMVASHPEPGRDVREFLDDYLAPEWFGCSGRRTAEVLDRVAPELTRLDVVRGRLQTATRTAAARVARLAGTRGR